MQSIPSAGYKFKSAGEKAPEPEPIPIITPEKWAGYVAAVDETRIAELTAWRGYSRPTVDFLKSQLLIGICQDKWAFPNIDRDGEIRSIHCRVPPSKSGAKANWYYKPKGANTHALVFGQVAKAKKIAIHESQWDAIAQIDELGIECIVSQDWAIVATRGAAGTRTLQELEFASDAEFFLFPQNDTPAKRWTDAVVKVLGRSVRLVATPSNYKDLNEWSKNGLSAEALRNALGSAVLKEAPVKPESEQTSKTKTGLAEQTARKLEEQAREVATNLEAYYDQVRKEYVVKTDGGTYQSVTETQFNRDLRFRDLMAKRIPSRNWSQTDIVIREIQKKRYIQYVGALAGRDAGFYNENGVRFVVTNSPTVIEPRKGLWPTIHSFLKGLLWDDEEPYSNEQQAVFLGWWQVAYNAFRARKFQPGQAIAIAGEIGSGKSLLQRIISQSLGGRSAKAALFLQGRTDFNGELFEAEHLVLEDEAASTRYPERVALGVAIKNLVANEIQPCHPKHRQIVNLAPWWRVSISLNDEPERLLVLPPSLTTDMADKIILLRATLHPMPMPSETAEERLKFWKTLLGELPAFLYWLVNDFKIPEGWHVDRFGVRAWQHPLLLEALNELSPAIALLDLIDRAKIWNHDAEGIFQAVPTVPWVGTALELRAQLVATTSTQRDAERLLNWINAAGQHLNELERIRGARVKKFWDDNTRKYEIYPIV